MPERYRLEPGDWHHLSLVEGGGISESPIRIDRVEWRPRGWLRLSVYHAWHSEGLRDKVYELQVTAQNATNLMAKSLEVKGRVLHLRPIPREPPGWDELERASRVLHACGLRFDGYAYAETMKPKVEEVQHWLLERLESFVRTLRLPDCPEEVHALLFTCQRRAKEQGWFSDRSAESQASLLLFLHAYREPVPARWHLAIFGEEWARIRANEREEAAATVRRWMGCG